MAEWSCSLSQLIWKPFWGNQSILGTRWGPQERVKRAEVKACTGARKVIRQGVVVLLKGERADT